MIGILVQLIISWLLLWLIEKQSLSALGILPNTLRLKQFALFFTVTSLCCAFGFWLQYVIGKQTWILNPNLNAGLVWDGIWWNIKSVLFEELAFRGALLYVLIQKLNKAKAIIISACAFGIYHWFSQGSFGNSSAMLTTFLVTGSMGLVLAYGFSKSASMYIPTAIHFGWNYTQQSIFSSGPIGKQIFILAEPKTQVTISYFTYFSMLLLPVLAALVINALLIKKYVSSTSNS